MHAEDSFSTTYARYQAPSYGAATTDPSGTLKKNVHITLGIMKCENKIQHQVKKAQFNKDIPIYAQIRKVWGISEYMTRCTSLKGFVHILN